MLFHLFSIFFLVAQCAAVTTITMVTKSPSETEMSTEVLRLLNDPRRSLIYDLNVSDLYWLKWDMSLAWLAFKTTDTCEPLDDSDGFAKLRLTLSDKEIVTTTNNQETKTQHRIVSDLWENLDAFTEHIKEYGAELKNSREEFSKFYDYYRRDWTRIGCAFKVCKDVMTGEENNLICFLGPKADQKSDPIFTVETSKDDLCKNCECEKLACKEPQFDGSKLTDDEFQKKVLDEFNGARSKFSSGVNVSAMSKLVWDDTLTASALDVANNCPGQVTHGTNYREVLADTFLDKAAGLSSIGEMYGSTTTEQSYTEVYDWSAVYTILWPKMTKVGCARAPNTCVNKIWCHFGDIGLLNGKMYEKGKPCSKCTGGCEDGLCI